MFLTPYLEDLEQRIVPEVEEALHAQWRTFASGEWEGDLFCPRRPAPIPPGIEWPAVTVNEALEDFEKMALQQLCTCSQALAAGNGALLCVRCNYGTGILPTVFGTDLFVMDPEANTLPTSIPLEGGAEAIRRLVDAGIPDVHNGLGGRVFKMAERFMEWFAPYPKVRRWVAIYHPDLQGPMDVCELLWGSSLFTAVLDAPDLLHKLLDLVTRTYAVFMEEWNRRVPAYDPPWSVHWSMLHRGRIMLRDDSAMNFSPAMFDEFIRPYDARLLRDLGGGGLHFCGKGDHYIPSAGEMSGLHAVNLSQPEYNDMEVIFRHTVDRGIQIIGLDRRTAEKALRRGRDLHGNVHCW